MGKFALSYDSLIAIKDEMNEYVSDDPYNHPEEMFMPIEFVNARLGLADRVETDYANLISLYNQYNSFSSDINLNKLKNILTDLSLRYLSKTCLSICSDHFY